MVSIYVEIDSIDLYSMTFLLYNNNLNNYLSSFVFTLGVG